MWYEPLKWPTLEFKIRRWFLIAWIFFSHRKLSSRFTLTELYSMYVPKPLFMAMYTINIDRLSSWSISFCHSTWLTPLTTGFYQTRHDKFCMHTSSSINSGLGAGRETTSWELLILEVSYNWGLRIAYYS